MDHVQIEWRFTKMNGSQLDGHRELNSGLRSRSLGSIPTYHKQMVQVGLGSCKNKNVTADLICSSRYTVASSNSSDKYVIVASKFYKQLVLHDELTLSAKDWIKWQDSILGFLSVVLERSPQFNPR